MIKDSSKNCNIDPTHLLKNSVKPQTSGYNFEREKSFRNFKIQ